MEKDERLKLVNEKGETILMTKSEYMELAKQKGWDTKIPQFEDYVCDCDVFGGDNIVFHFMFIISGTLYLKDNAVLEENVFARDGIFLGDGASTWNLCSDNGDVIIGALSETCELIGKNVICGNYLYTNKWSIFATDGFVILGENVRVVDNDNSIISASEDIICDDEPAAEDGQSG